ncbi:hypothetical protein ACLOJK_032216 [Asimina triloba]
MKKPRDGLRPKLGISLYRKRSPVAHGLFNGLLVRRSIPISLAVLVLVFLLVWWWSALLSVSFFHICLSSPTLEVYCFSAGTRPEFKKFLAQDKSEGGSKYENGNGGEDNGENANIGGDGNGDGAATNVNSSSRREEEDHDAADQNNDGTDSNGNSSTDSNGNSSIGLDSENDGSKNSGGNDRYENGDDKSVVDVEHAALHGHNISINVSNMTLDEEIAIAIQAVKDQMQSLRSSVDPSNRTDQACDGRGIFVYDLPPKFNEDLVGQCREILTWTNFCKYLTHDAMGEPIRKLGKGWHNTHQYSLEPIFHSKVLKHPCRVRNPDEAKLFYVPFYGGMNILRWHFKSVSKDVKDQLGQDLIKWLEAQPTWTRHAGRRHVFVLGKISWDFRRNDDFAWGTNFLELPQMQNPYKLLIERQPWHANDVGVPHPTNFHPHTDDDIGQWQSKIMRSNRRNLISFAGAARPEAVENIRSVLIQQCKSSDGYCRFFDCKTGACSKPQSIIKLFVESEFCLQPPGDSPTRKSVFDSLLSGCIPVLFDPFTAYYQYPWHLPEDYRRYSVFVDKEDVKAMKVNVVERLKMVTPKERAEMRRYIVNELLPGLVYGDSNTQFVKFRDAFTVSMDNLIDLVNRQSQL